ncbi:Sodium/hydrogen exchanger family-domain-containing protein [Roridomyces roridus]|uniref:Sodium/hydrogen exchanger family-domain-containing protein n=1 Tax=Roridomyces roridus TaxID=1738132 RepID=A0AAD7BJQ9_9AGAR|nr:Sodium/hydrogen exchanger family-domain-containing protein [Roridomyces roridus]
MQKLSALLSFQLDRVESFFSPSTPGLSLSLRLMSGFSTTVVGLFQRAATEQGGLLSGQDPSSVNLTDPIRLWIIQVGVIVGTATLLSLGLRKLNQPKVIAEVLGGILLGPTAFGRIPGFTEHIFPKDSIPFLSLVANIGLVLFLFLVGLEIDAAIIKRNAKLSAAVGLAGMILPFGLGAALTVPLYRNFVDDSIRYAYFALFCCVAFSITAFPVLCRILTELKLLDTTVGIVVLSAGVANDILGWTLLALSVALVNAGSALSALWILLICVGWTLFLLFPVKIALRWLAHKTGSVENGPTMFFMTITILLVFGSAFFTDIIGVHAIFGAFLVGLIVPREGSLAIALTEKLEDMVSIIFLPLYFTLSGLSTDLGLLDNGITWGFTFAVISVAFIGKFGGCTLAARYAAGFSWRESSTIGSLMSCKGLVELIVLNVGLSAGILSPRVFAIFVLEALTLTFMTTPLVTWLYPPEKRVRASGTGANFNAVAGDDRPGRTGSLNGSRSRYTFVLDKLEHIPGMMAMAQLIQPPPPSGEERPTASKSSLIRPSDRCSVEALRLIELSDRVSAVMKSSASETLLLSDPLLAIFRMHGQLHDLHISTALSIVPFDDLASSVTEHAQNTDSDMIMLPWLPTPSAETTVALHEHEALQTPGKSQVHNPFDMLFKSTGSHDKSASALHAQFVREVFSNAKTDVALFVDQERSAVTSKMGSKQHLFLPFFGGPDDRLALEFVVQLCASSHVTATVVRVTKREMEPPLSQVTDAHIEKREEPQLLSVTSAVAGFPDTVYGPPTTETRMQSETADNIAWDKYVPSTNADGASTSSTPPPGIEFRELTSPIPLHAVIREVNLLSDTVASQERAPRVLLVVGRSRRMAVENHAGELKELVGEYGSVGAEVRKTLGDVATSFVVTGAGSGIVVVQTAAKIDDY